MTSMEALRAILRDEMLQLLATAAIAFALVGTQAVLDNYLSAALEGTGDPPGSMMAAAQGKLGQLRAGTVGVLDNLAWVSIDLGREASKGIFCNFLGVGFSIVNCSPLNAFRGSLTSTAFTASVALADTYAQSFILSMVQSFAFNFIIPIGLFLRCFKVSRQAGGALIAIGFGFYAVYPTVIVATDNMLHRCAVPLLSIPGPGTCNPSETDISESLDQFQGYSNSITSFDLVSSIAYFVLVRVLFMSILNLIITLGFIRMFAHLIGSEIDVSSLARIS